MNSRCCSAARMRCTPRSSTASLLRGTYRRTLCVPSRKAACGREPMRCRSASSTRSAGLEVAIKSAAALAKLTGDYDIREYPRVKSATEMLTELFEQSRSRWPRCSSLARYLAVDRYSNSAGKSCGSSACADVRRSARRLCEDAVHPHGSLKAGTTTTRSSDQTIRYWLSNKTGSSPGEIPQLESDPISR
jgi:hypothetical protein